MYQAWPLMNAVGEQLWSPDSITSLPGVPSARYKDQCSRLQQRGILNGTECNPPPPPPPPPSPPPPPPPVSCSPHENVKVRARTRARCETWVNFAPIFLVRTEERERSPVFLSRTDANKTHVHFTSNPAQQHKVRRWQRPPHYPQRQRLLSVVW